MPPPADRAPALPERWRSLADALHHRARVQPEEPAYSVLSERGQEESAITFGELGARATALARHLASRAPPGERALLLCPNGIEFLVGLFGCVLAGIIAVPMMLPRRQSRRDASAAIIADCTPRLALSLNHLIGGDLPGRIPAGIEFVAIDDDMPTPASAALPAPPAREDLALLQYTSGSTSSPKGVIVSHANLLANLAMIQTALGNSSRSTCVSWVPLYHDMGLVLAVLQSLYVGARCVLLPPVAFLQRPLLWLCAISDYRAEVAVAPNFAYDLCCERYRAEQMDGVDLSCWRLALNGAEPVRAETIRRFTETFAKHGFAAEAVYPAYGMAEATVLISAGRRGAGPVFRHVSRAGLQRHRVIRPCDADDEQTVVGCGKALPGEEIAIVDPDHCTRLGPDRVGEIWVAGPHVVSGYWCNNDATAEAFAARIDGERETGWLRTGDLGFLDASGELFITGRIKEVVIIRGANHYPQDIEETVQNCDPALRRHGGAAFAVAGAAGGDQLVVMQEVERTRRHDIDRDEIVGRIREAIVREHDIAPYRIALLRPGALPKTTSGKIQRALCRQFWLAGSLDLL